ncbi:DUF6287 domain-containing protein [Furfurilactobacillus sp. WILCCON 0119]
MAKKYFGGTTRSPHTYEFFKQRRDDPNWQADFYVIRAQRRRRAVITTMVVVALVVVGAGATLSVTHTQGFDTIFHRETAKQQKGIEVAKATTTSDDKKTTGESAHRHQKQGSSASSSATVTASSSSAVTPSTKVAATAKATSQAAKDSSMVAAPAKTQTASTQELVAAGDIDSAAMAHGDMSSLVGTWKNGAGSVATVHADGSVQYNNPDGTSYTNYMNKWQMSSSGVGMQVGPEGLFGYYLAAYPIGVKNQPGDQSDTSKPRLIGTQNADNYSADSYYYRQGQ